MSKFVLLGLNAHGELQPFDLLATHHDDAMREAIRYARQAGVQIVEVRAADPRHRAGAARFGLRRAVFLRRRPFDLALFVYELLTLLRAGLALTEALETLDERWRQSRSGASSEQGQEVLPELVRLMHQGKSFSAALALHTRHFSTLFVAMIAASEQTGGMTDALERYLHYHSQVGVVRQKLISASLYPALLMLTGSAVALFLIWFLAPRFAHVYEGMPATGLPVLSRGLLVAGLFVSEHTVASLGVLSVLLIGVSMLLTRPSMQQRGLAWIGQIGWIDDKLKLLQLARFYRSLGMLLQGGVALLPSLDMTRELLPPPLQLRLSRAMTVIAQGQTMSDSLEQQGLMTTVARRLLRAGERNGQIAVMLEQAAMFHEREIAQWVERFARLVEPLLMLVMGLGIGTIVVLLYLPVFDLAGNLQ
ncbi:type II secretion system F family protein [Burkholderia cepacia]|uniref:type II secretion system F family protein n=1 Tax=Burkholderia cepacia TaxID=292 RepID=UPI001CF1F181|nr:type II secretion system F family protein [Burkholderia cepacia]MCA7938702.1 type II secretion system F family protein [Burkholderia cepacia]MDN7616447.1 type II secretion system F family protein [Burkholderia cepacia]